MLTLLSSILLVGFLLAVSGEPSSRRTGYLKTEGEPNEIRKRSLPRAGITLRELGPHASVTAVQSEPQTKEASEKDYTTWMSVRDGFRYCYCQKDINATAGSDPLPTDGLLKLCFCETFFLFDSIKSGGYVPVPEGPTAGTQDWTITEVQKEKYRQKLECFQAGFHWMDCILKNPEVSTEKNT